MTTASEKRREIKETIMKKTLFCMGVGAGLMYLLDPELGEVRRSMLRDRLSGSLPKTSDAIHAKAEAIGSKATDLTARADEAAAEAITTIGPHDGEQGESGGDRDGKDAPYKSKEK